MISSTPTPRLRAYEAAKEAAGHLAEDPRVQLVFVFGSVVDPRREKVGDVDLAIVADPPIGLEDRLRLQADLVAATGVEIDLVPLSGASVALIYEVIDSGCCLFARSPEAETDFVVRARARYLDFKPFLEEQWRLAGERAEERLNGPPS